LFLKYIDVVPETEISLRVRKKLYTLCPEKGIYLQEEGFFCHS